jgi:quinol monooxygenase YgiN
MVAAIFEAELNPEQARRLAELMDEGRPTRPEKVIVATLTYDDPHAVLTAVWESREALEAYLATTDVPRGRELMRKVGVEPTMRVVDVLEHA